MATHGLALGQCAIGSPTRGAGTPVLAAKGLHKRFGTTDALRGVDVEIATGKMVAIMGPSGSGRSTLLYCLAGHGHRATGGFADEPTGSLDSPSGERVAQWIGRPASPTRYASAIGPIPSDPLRATSCRYRGRFQFAMNEGPPC